MQKRRFSDVYRNSTSHQLANVSPNQPIRFTGKFTGKELAKLDIPWSQANWRELAEIWIEKQLAAEKLSAIAPIEMVKVWALATIWRVKTTGGTVYFKASAPLFAQEAEATGILAALYPENLPNVLATNPENNWILMREIDGELLENIEDISHWQAALSNWAQFQINAGQQREHLISLGWLDLGLAEITSQISQVFSLTPALLRDKNFSQWDLWKLLPLVPKFKAVCQQLTHLGIPDTLIHGDLSPRNIYIRDRVARYFDWSDTCISHPFFDLIRFLYEIEKDLPHVPDARSRIRNAYLEPWTIYAPMSQLISTFELVSETLVSLYEIIRDRLIQENYGNHGQWPTEAAVPFYLQRLLIQVATYLQFSQQTQ